MAWCKHPRTVIHWNGHDVPVELRVLPPGAYVVERTLTADEAERARLDFEEIGVDVAYRRMRVEELGPWWSPFKGLPIETLGELETRAPEIARDNPRRWPRLPRVLRALPADVEILAANSWRDLAERALVRVTPQQALVLRLRLGLDGEPQSRRAIGRMHKVTSTAIHSRERGAARRWRFGWSTRVIERLDAIVGGRTLRVDSLVKKDPFFEPLPSAASLAMFLSLAETRATFDFLKRRGVLFVRRAPRRDRAELAAWKQRAHAAHAARRRD